MKTEQPVNLTLLGTSLLHGGRDKAGIDVAVSNTLVITAASTGTLTADGGAGGAIGAAGIGDSLWRRSGGTITINGGIINATGGNDDSGGNGGSGAGIGGSGTYQANGDDSWNNNYKWGNNKINRWQWS